MSSPPQVFDILRQLNTFVWVCHPYESKPELGRIISIEVSHGIQTADIDACLDDASPEQSQSYGPGTNPKLYYTIMKQRLDEFNWRWTDTYTGVFDYDEIELVELVSQGLAFLGRYVEDPLLCR